MLPEIIEVFRKAAVDIVESGVATIEILGRAIFDIFRIIITGIGAASPFELLGALLVLGGALYIAYKLFLDSAKAVVVFLIVLVVLVIVFFVAFM